MIDVDDFKQTNDTFGHLVGDEVLRFIARNIASSIRASDIAARYGGDEFIVAFYNTTEQQALQIAERIREKNQKLQRTQLWCGYQLRCGTTRFGPRLHENSSKSR